MQIIESKISDKWLKASVMGSIWAANEILLGSFLHNIRVPLSGTIMAFLSIALLVSFSEMWKDKGLVWRAGLIAALMKSISPSAIILGPMIGIAMEGFLLSFGIFLLGRNLAGYMIGGALAVISILLQKVGRLLISYGFDFLQILNNIFIYASKQLRFNTDRGIVLILTLLVIYALVGIAGSLLGYYGGRTAKKLQGKELINSSSSKHAHLFAKSEKRSYSLILLIFHLAAIILGMYLINTSPLMLILPFLTIYITFSIIYYKAAIRKLRNPTFWIWFIGITFLASYFLGDWQAVDGFNIDGLKEGLFMNLRAALVLIGFAAISTELKNPLIKIIMYKRGAAQLYQSMELAFGILPLILESFPSTRNLFKKPAQNISGLISKADDFLKHITLENKLKSKVLIITGDIHQGKTTLLKNIISELRLKNIKVNGFFTEVIRNNQELKGYVLIPLKTNNPISLCSTDPETGSKNYGRFFFSDRALKIGNETLLAAVDDASIIVIDEIGPMEISGDGWDDAIDIICRGSGIPMIWTVRKSLAGKAARKWSVGDVRIVDIGDKNAMEDVQMALREMLPNIS